MQCSGRSFGRLRRSNRFAAVGAGAVRVVREDGLVPRVSEFYGIVIEMYFDDHPPPHFHARYAADEALFVIVTGEVFGGSLPLARSGSCENGLRFTETSLLPTGARQALQPPVPVAPLP